MATKLKWPKPDGEYGVPLYGGRVYLFKTTTKLIKALEFLKTPTLNDFTDYHGTAQELVRDSDGARIYLIGVFNNSLNTLVHECCHVALMVSEYVGVKPIESNGEPFCYFLDDMFDKLQKSFKPNENTENKKMTEEGKVKELIKKFLKKYSIDYTMIIPSAFGSSTGVSDFCCILPDGKWLAIEAKKLGGKATPLQLKFLDKINSAGGIGCVVDGTKSLEELEALLRSKGYLGG